MVHWVARCDCICAAIVVLRLIACICNGLVRNRVVPTSAVMESNLFTISHIKRVTPLLPHIIPLPSLYRSSDCPAVLQDRLCRQRANSGLFNILHLQNLQLGRALMLQFLTFNSKNTVVSLEWLPNIYLRIRCSWSHEAWSIIIQQFTTPWQSGLSHKLCRVVIIALFFLNTMSELMGCEVK